MTGAHIRGMNVAEPRVFAFTHPFLSLNGIASKEITVVAENLETAVAEVVRRVNAKRDRGFLTPDEVTYVGEWSRSEHDALPPAPGQRTTTGLIEVLSAGFYATGDSNQSDGRGPQRDLGEFATYDEALGASRGKGVQGSDGRVGAYRWVRRTGGKLERQTRTVREHRRDPGSPSPTYSVGLIVDEALLNDPNNFFKD